MYSRQKVHSQVSRMFADEYLLFIPPAIPCSLISGDDWTILSGLWRLKFAAPLPWTGFNLLRLLMAGAPEPGRSPSSLTSLTSLRSPERVVTYANLFTRREQMAGRANSQSSANNIPRGIIIPSSQCKRISLIHIIQNHNKTLLQLTASQYYPRVPGK